MQRLLLQHETHALKSLGLTVLIAMAMAGLIRALLG